MEILCAVWCSYGDSLCCLVLVWRFIVLFGVHMEIFCAVWCLYGDSLCCLVLVWRFIVLFGVHMEILCAVGVRMEIPVAVTETCWLFKVI
jgi:hypothetical protein